MSLRARLQKWIISHSKRQLKTSPLPDTACGCASELHIFLLWGSKFLICPCGNEMLEKWLLRFTGMVWGLWSSSPLAGDLLIQYWPFLCSMNIFHWPFTGRRGTHQLALPFTYLDPQHRCGTEWCWWVQGHDGVAEGHQGKGSQQFYGSVGTYNYSSLMRQHLECQRVDSGIKTNCNFSKWTLPKSMGWIWL